MSATGIQCGKLASAVRVPHSTASGASLFDDAAAGEGDAVGKGARAGGDAAQEAGVLEMERRGVVGGVAGGEAGGDEFVVGGAAVGVGVEVGAGTAREDGEAVVEVG